MSETPQPITPQVGYLYHYPRFDHPTDNFQLDIFIFPTPTEQHFDVLRVHFTVQILKDRLDRLTISHPWDFEKTAHVCAGLVEMEDRKGKKEEAFTFGGRLDIETQNTLTTCTLVSSAPILEISGATPMAELFAEELEILLAERKAALIPTPHEYEKRLIKAKPLQLYCACLEALIQKFEHFPLKDDKYFQFLSYLHSQKHRCEATGLAKGPAPALADIL